MEIAEKMNMTLSVYRATLHSYQNLMRMELRKKVRSYDQDGMTYTEIAEKLGLSKHAVLSMLSDKGGDL